MGRGPGWRAATDPVLPCHPPQRSFGENHPVTSGRASGGPSRGADAPTRTTGTRDGMGAIVAILALGLVFRLIIALLNPGSGFRVDLISFQFWAGDLAKNGLFGFYTRPFFHDYTPGYLYVLWLVGTVHQAFTAVGGVGDLIKIPPIVAVVTIRRALWPVRSDHAASGVSRNHAAIVSRLIDWERRTDHPIRIVTTGLAGFLTAVVLCFPFGLSVIGPPTAPGSLFTSG